MLLQIRCLRTLVAAFIAVVGLLSAVGEHVLLYVISKHALVVTQFTLEALFSAMNQHVRFKASC